MKQRRVAFIWLLVSILSIFLFADYFHTETTLKPEDDCPICLWERQVIAISQLYFLFVLAIFSTLYRFLARQDKARTLAYIYNFNCRAPPAVSGN